MAKKKKKVTPKVIAPQFPAEGNPMDEMNHPVNNLPDPTGGLYNPMAMGY